MTRQELKLRARILIQTVRPPVMLVAFALVAIGWLFSLLEQRIGASPLYIDMQAVEAMDAENVFVVDYSRVTGFAVFLTFVFQMMSAILDFGFVRYCLNVHREQPSGFSDLFSGFENPWRVLGLWLLEGVLVGLLSLLFIIPGLVMGYAWSMSRQLLSDHPDWSPARCMRESRSLMRGHKWELFLLHLSFFGWFLLRGLVPAVSVFLSPYLGLSESGFYRALVGDTRQPDPEGTKDDTLPPWKM